nr:thiamine-phosphate kinase [uncultured Anaeromusa sp.]
MKICEVGEFGLIRLLQEETQMPGVIVGIGDDAAVIQPTPDQVTLLTTDMLVEGVHFVLTTTDAWSLGWKAMAANLSDIAAMGGSPRHALISLALPQECQVEFVQQLYQGMRALAKEYNVGIIGGDTVSSLQGLVLNVVVTGEAFPQKVCYRSGAQCGDVVVLTGTVGDSAAGLWLLGQKEAQDEPWARPLQERHLRPRPQVAWGKILSEAGVNSLNDISDGLASEANEIAEASGVSIELRGADVPFSPEMLQAAARAQINPLEWALYGGEDYQLLGTMAPDTLTQLQRETPQLPLTVIGTVSRGQGVYLRQKDVQRTLLQPRGYNHFQQEDL